jgi:hypothetical protein
VLGATTINGLTTTNTLSVLGATTISGLTTTNTLSVLGATTINGLTTTNTLSVLGATTISGLTTTNTLSVLGATTISGLTTTNTLSVLGATTIVGSLSVSGSVTMGGLTFVDLVLSNLSAAGTVTAGTFNASSDYRIKTNVAKLTSIINIDNLNPVKYYNIRSEKEDIGLIAHELQEYFPFLVTGKKDGEEIQTVNYNGLIGVLIKEVQELKKRVFVLENKK